MNQIDLNPFTKTPVSIGGKVYGMLSTVFTKWFDQIVAALNRPTLSNYFTFPLTPSGTSSYRQVAFPLNTVGLKDSPILTAPAPPSGCSFSAYITIPDQVTIAFENFSGAPQTLALPQQYTVTVLKN